MPGLSSAVVPVQWDQSSGTSRASWVSVVISVQWNQCICISVVHGSSTVVSVQWKEVQWNQ